MIARLQGHRRPPPVAPPLQGAGAAAARPAAHHAMSCPLPRTHPADRSIYQAAEDFGIKMPASCLSGSCSACCGKVLKGAPPPPPRLHRRRKRHHACLAAAWPSSPLTPPHLPITNPAQAR